ncbi:hypothetical protein RDI58_003266 [Solanum bulbocastanum]|uniref:RING-type E3 ubiquitin transferase n=1 Tax=Solanum bulbocastanum TaxID=147425 RepID=A0AAN8UH72_SOLBU
MSFHIDQKLIYESLDNSTGKTCGSYYCNPEVNHSRICPLSCFYICQGICLFPEIELPPLPQNFTTEVPLSQSPQKNTASIFLIILFTGLGIAVYIFYSLVIHKNSRTSSQPEQQVVVEDEEEELSDIRTVGLHPSVISTITIRKYKRGEGQIEGTECSVCLSEFREDETFKILPTCNHAFHKLALSIEEESRSENAMELRLDSRYEGESRSVSNQLAAAMVFHDRKLIFESLDNSTGKSCSSYYCNPKENLSRICPISCMYICYPICSFPLFSEIQPPLPPNFFTPKVPISQSPHKPTISIFLIILFSVLATSFFLFCCFVVYRIRNAIILSRPQQRVEVEEEEEFSDIVDEDIHGPMVDHPIWYIRTVGLQPSIISAITICKYKTGEGIIEGTECCVCLSEFEEDETLRILPKCNHAFHIPCIDTWLRSHTNCPMCRAGIVIAPAAAPSLPEQVFMKKNATELTLEIENEGESLELSSMDIKEDVGNGTNEGVLSEFSASRRSTSFESLSTASILTCASVSQSTLDGNEMSARMKNLCLDRVMQEQQMIRRSQSAVLLR